MTKLNLAGLRRASISIAAFAFVVVLGACGGGGSSSASLPGLPNLPDAPAAKFVLSAKVSGLKGTGLVLQNSAGSDVAVAVDGTITLSPALAIGTAYAVTVRTQPAEPSQVCTVGNASGVVGTSDVTDLTVICSTQSFSVSGTVSGLAGSGLVLQNSAGDDLAISAPGGAFRFAMPVASGGSYVVTVKTQPGTPSQICSVGNASGTVTDHNIAGVSVVCATQAFTVGGTVTGLPSGTNVVLRNNGTDDTAVLADGAFTFATPVADTAAYAITVARQPQMPWYVCTVSQGSATMTGAAVSNVLVVCKREVHVSTLVSNRMINQSIAADRDGNVYGTFGNEIFKITRAGVVSVLAGSGTLGTANGHGTSASFFDPRDIAVVKGNIYVVERSVIRKITPEGDVTDFIDMGAGAQPRAITGDQDGNFFVVDSYHLIRKIAPDGTISLLAGSTSAGSSDGNGASASFYFPRGLAADGAGNVYVADTNNNMVRKITPAGDVTTLMSLALNGFVWSPGSVGVDATGNVFVADRTRGLVRQISPSGQLSILAGSGTPGQADGEGSVAQFEYPVSVVPGADNELFVLDYYMLSIRRISTTR